MAILGSSRRKFLAVLLLLGASCLAGLAQQPAPEYRLKALFLYNFAQFVDWPPAAFSDSDSPLVIGVVGKNPFGQTLTEAVSGEKIKNRRLEVRYFKDATEMTDCQILYVNATHAGERSAVLKKIKGRNVLTVGDSPDFIESGGLVRFFTENNKLRFAINLEAVKAAKISVSSKLLQLAEVVSPGKQP